MFQVIRGDISNLPFEVDAIVNSADTEVKYNFGVDLAIYRAAGEEQLLQARKAIGKIKAGNVRITDSFALKDKAKKIFHAVAPIYQGGHCGEMKLLRSCYKNCFALALKENFANLALPILGTGNNGFPINDSLRVAIAESVRFLLENEDFNITLVTFDTDTYEKCKKLFGIGFVKEFIADTDVKKMQSADERAGARIFRRNQPKRADDKTLNKNFLETLAEFMKRIGLNLNLNNADDLNDLINIVHLGNISDRVIYSIRNAINEVAEYNPSKETAIRFAIALKLSVDDASELLSAAGHVLYNGNSLDRKIKNFMYQKSKTDQLEKYEIKIFEEEIPDFVKRERARKRRNRGRS